MAGSHHGAGSHMPVVQNNQMGLGQHGVLLYDKQYAGRISPNTNDDVANKFWSVIDSNKNVRNGIERITELSKQKLMDMNSKNRTLVEKVEKLKMELEHCELKLVEASQNYENAKVVVLTYKTRNIHLETAAKELEIISAELEELRKKSSNFERANTKISELKENLRYSEEVANKSRQEVNQLQQILQARSQKIDKLNMVIRNIAEHSQVPPDRLQWMMDEAWKQEQQSQQSLLQLCDQLRAALHEKDMLISQLEHQNGELQNRKSEAETYSRIKGKNMSTEKIESLAAKLDNAQMCIDRMNQEIEDLKRESILKSEELKKKDGAIKGLQEILKKEQKSHQEKLMAMQGDHSTQNQQEINELKQLNEKLHDKVGELSQKCEHAETEYAILKSVDLQSREELQKYKEKVISLEHDIRKGKQVESDLYKELDEALKDLENISKRYRSLQNENSELKRGQSMPVFSGTDDSQLVQELDHKSKQVEIMHGQIKQYADSLDREKRKVSMLTMENQNYQQQLQQFQTGVPPLPPRSPIHHNKTQPVANTHRGWEGTIPSPAMVVSRDTGSSHLKPTQHMLEPTYYSERYKQYDTNAGRSPYDQFNTHPQDRSRTTPLFNSEPGLPEPCPLCGKRFATTEQLTIHAASCNS